MNPENQSQMINIPFRVKSTWDVYDEEREWCMTAKSDSENSRVHIRECNENGALQMWSTDSQGQIRLLTESNLCIRVKDRMLYLDQCFERGDIENTFEIHPDKNEISHVDIDGQRYLFGLREWRKWGRVLLLEEDYDNDTMQTWNFEIDSNALTESPTKSPTVSPSFQPSRSPTPLPSPSPSSRRPTVSPSVSPSTLQPSRSPTPLPSPSPSSRRPTVSPSVSPSTLQPSRSHSTSPSTQSPSKLSPESPSEAATVKISTVQPSESPMFSPSNSPSLSLSSKPSTLYPTGLPSHYPSISASTSPSSFPQETPSIAPTFHASTSPSSSPSFSPSLKENDLYYENYNSSSYYDDDYYGNTTDIDDYYGNGTDIDDYYFNNRSVNATDDYYYDDYYDDDKEYNNSISDENASMLTSPRPSFVPTNKPSQKETNKPSAGPSLSPSITSTTQPSMEPSRSTSLNPSQYPSRSPTYLLTRQPFSVTKSPEVQGTRDAPTSGTDMCELRDGKYGEETEKKFIIEYFYKMIYNEESSPNDLLKVLDKSIAEKVITDSGVFPQCSNQLSGGKSTIVGISSLPMDQFNSFCGPRCAVVEGSLTLYGSSSGSRQLSTEFELEDVMSSIEDALSGGDLVEGSTDLLDLSFLSPDDSLISKNSIGIPSNRTTPQTSGESGFPIWAYIAAASGAIVVAVLAFFAMKRRGKNNQNDVFRRDNIDENEISADAAPASIDRRDLTLQDDGSASFI